MSGQSRRDVLSVVISGIANRNPVGVTLTHRRRALQMKRGHSYGIWSLAINPDRRLPNSARSSVFIEAHHSAAAPKRRAMSAAIAHVMKGDLAHCTPTGLAWIIEIAVYKHSTPTGLAWIIEIAVYKHSTPMGLAWIIGIAVYKHSTPTGLAWIIGIAVYKHSTPTGCPTHCRGRDSGREERAARFCRQSLNDLPPASTALWPRHWRSLRYRPEKRDFFAILPSRDQRKSSVISVIKTRDKLFRLC